nr:MAG TPA: hypothetical protein [Caudoviricetes sp.]
MGLCYYVFVKSLKQVYFFIILLLGMRAVWAFYRSQFFGGNRCNEPLSYIFQLRQSCVGQAWLSFLYAERS